ncbi:DnaB-like helicase C-terminal domain-containing protein [Larkinella sp. C7]|uniref:replicative DNA helicase n=1 Tax=Larkinella sp. C7 TaxID=2576607 RepID=UPI001110FC6B|nr:DnaB-like helicase C-terminal domain-containing protein [Larkinella sp. C7]
MNNITTSTHLINVDLELEAAVLGSVLTTPDKAGELLRYIQKSAIFYKEFHQHVYQAIAHLYSQGQECDFLAAKQWLQKNGHDTIGLMPVVEKGGYFDLTPKCLFLYELAVKRFLGQYGQRMIRMSADPTTDALQLLERVDGDIDNIMGAIQSMKRPTVNDHLKLFLNDLDGKVKREGPYSGLLTGIQTLDEQTNGLKSGGFYVLAAGTGIGKTAIAGHIIKHQILQAGNAVGLCTLEMKGSEILGRFVAAETGYSNFELDRGKGLDYRRINQAVTKLSGAPLHIWDKPIELVQLKYQASEWKRRHGIKLLVIDYLQLVKHSLVKNRYERVSDISSTCKEMAQEMDIAVLALAQLNRDHEKREGWKKRPKLSDLRESGQIEQDSDGVMMLFRPHKYGLSYDKSSIIITPQTLEIHLPKWRNGMPTDEDYPLLTYYDAPTNRVGSTPFPDVPF